MENITKKLRFKIGGYSTLMAAQNDAKDFEAPSVFEYRSGIFPNPVNFRLKLKTLSSAPFAWPRNAAYTPMNTHYIDIEVEATGPEKKIDDWERKVNQSIKIFHPDHIRLSSSMGDRAEHIREREDKKD